jgi:hypothetical protein
MTNRATNRKVKRSFTLAPESVAFLSATRRQRKAASDSEALDLLLKELLLEAKRREVDAAFNAYYDNASNEQLGESSEWASMAGPTVLLSSDRDPNQ